MTKRPKPSDSVWQLSKPAPPYIPTEEEEVLAAMVNNNLTVPLMPNKTFRVEVEVRNIVDWQPPVVGPEDY